MSDETDRFNLPERVRVFRQERYGGEWVPSNLADAVKWLADKLDSVPPQYRHTATIEIDSISSWEDSSYATIEIAYERPATPEEVAARKAEARERAASDLAWARSRVAAAERRIAELAASAAD